MNITLYPDKHDPNRIDPMLAKIKELWEKVPDLRLGQFLGNCAKSDLKLYYIEDDKLLEKLENMYSQADRD